MKEKKGEKKRKESTRHKKAFERYAELMLEGDNAAVAKVADEFKAKKGTVYNWSSRYCWRERYDEIEKEANQRALKQLARDIERQDINMIENIIKNLRKAEKSVVGSIEGFYSTKDYETLAKLYLLLTGRATEKIETENNTNVAMTEQDKETMKQFQKSINENIMNTKIDIKEDD